MHSGFRYRLLVLPDYIFASEIERYLFRKMRIVSWSITIQLICVTRLVVLRPIYIYPFLSISVKKATDNSFKFYSHRNQCHCLRLLIVVSDILLGIYQIASEYLLNIKNLD